MSFFLTELTINYEVILIVEEQFNKKKENEGWIYPDINQIRLLNILDTEVKYLICRNNKNLHFFSGFNSSKTLFSFFLKVIKNNKVYIITERPSHLFPKGIPRYFLYKFYFYIFKNRIKGILTIGSNCEKYFLKLGFSKKKLHYFNYTINLTKNNNLIFNKKDDEPIQFVFIGQFIKRKNILLLIRVFNLLKDLNNWRFTIIGSCSLQPDIEILIEKLKMHDRIIIKGLIPNNLIQSEIYVKSDFLILPSLFDGWGAVINEAIYNGVGVITNNSVGAHDIVKRIPNSGFIYNNENDLKLVTVNTDWGVGILIKNIITKNIKIDHTQKIIMRQKYLKLFHSDLIDTFNNILINEI